LPSKIKDYLIVILVAIIAWLLISTNLNKFEHRIFCNEIKIELSNSYHRGTMGYMEAAFYVEKDNQKRIKEVQKSVDRINISALGK